MVARVETISESKSRRRFLRSGLRNFRAGSNLHRAALPVHARCTMRDAGCRRCPAGGKKQYYLDQEIALYLLGGGNNGRYYDTTTGRFLSEDPTKESGGDVNLYRYTGNDPINNLDPSGHDSKKDPPKPVYHPAQTQPAQNPNANVHSNAPAPAQGQVPSDARKGAEQNILRQTDSMRQGFFKDEAPKPGQWLAGPAPDAGKQDTTGYTPAQLQIIHAHFERLFHNGPAMQYVNYGKRPLYDNWIAQARGAQARTGQSSGWPFAPTQNQRDIAQTPTVQVDGVNMPTNVARNSAAALDAVQASIDQAIAAGDFKRAEYLSAHEFDVPTMPTPHVTPPPGASLIPGMQDLANIHADWMTGHYSAATRNLKLGIASLGMAVIPGGADKNLFSELDIGPRVIGSSAKASPFSLPLAPESQGTFGLAAKFEHLPPSLLETYPRDFPAPSQPLRLVTGKEYAANRASANAVNNAVPHPDWHVHEIHSVKLGGDPARPANKLGVRPPFHYQLNTFWLRVQKLMEDTNAQ